MRKLKSIKQLLEEFPDAYFDDSGSLVLCQNTFVIDNNFLKLFGKEISREQFKECYFDEQWFEPVKEKKLYAFKRSSGTNIVHCINEDEILGWDRCPEFDLIFKD